MQVATIMTTPTRAGCADCNGGGVGQIATIDTTATAGAAGRSFDCRLPGVGGSDAAVETGVSQVSIYFADRARPVLKRADAAECMTFHPGRARGGRVK